MMEIEALSHQAGWYQARYELAMPVDQREQYVLLLRGQAYSSSHSGGSSDGIGTRRSSCSVGGSSKRTQTHDSIGST